MISGPDSPWYFRSDGFFKEDTGKYFVKPPTESEEKALFEEIRSPTISIKKYVNVHRLPTDKLDNSILDNDFEYFKIDSGMNINVPYGNIKEMRFRMSLFADDKQSGDAFAIDGFPNDTINHIQLLSGTVQLSMSGLLKFLPILYAAMDNAIQIDIKPWKFNWGYDKLKIRFSGAMTDTLDWYFTEDNVNRSFECYLTIKKRKFFY
ncbi:MAG: hypothetical protein WAM42_03445 [Candidatus Nitrosopolaris sp.]